MAQIHKTIYEMGSAMGLKLRKPKSDDLKFMPLKSS